MCIRDRYTPIDFSRLSPAFLFIKLPAQAAKNASFLQYSDCLLYTSDAADERSSVDLGGRRIIKKKNRNKYSGVYAR